VKESHIVHNRGYLIDLQAAESYAKARVALVWQLAMR